MQWLGIKHLQLPVLFPEHGHIVFEENGVHSYGGVNKRDIPVCVGDHVEASYSVLVLLLLNRRRVNTRSKQSFLLSDLDGWLVCDMGNHEVEHDIQTAGVLHC